MSAPDRLFKTFHLEALAVSLCSNHKLGLAIKFINRKIMSTRMKNTPSWKLKAISLFPELRIEIKKANNFYRFIMEDYLLYLDDAVKTNDKKLIQKIFVFIKWCYRSKDKRLWNPAAVCFYEALTVDTERQQLIAHYLEKTIFAEIVGLYKAYLNNSKTYKSIVDIYNRINKTTFQY